MNLRQPAVAGMFYPNDPEVLESDARNFLDYGKAALPENSTKVPALMAMLPHAGHVFCGKVIGRTLAAIDLPSRLIILCPSHTGKGKPLAVWADGIWRTPLGDVPVDTEITSALLDAPAQAKIWFTADREAHLGEHSIEVLLPFLQILIPDLRIAPVCVSCPPQSLEAAGSTLAEILQSFAGKNENIGVIISSDMNHFADEETTLRLDAQALAPFLELDPIALFNTVMAKRISMCGIFPATMALFACHALNITKPAVLAMHSTSAEASGDYNRVVGYAGAYIAR